MHSTAVIFAGGDDVPQHAVDALPPDAVVIAADSGLDLAYRLGVTVDVLIGDLDSVSAEALARAKTEGVLVERHPRDKNETDLELAFRVAMAEGAESVVVVGGRGGRFDHYLANALFIATRTGIDVEWRIGSACVYRVNGRLQLTTTPGATVSLLPIGGPARGIHTTGLRWKLSGDTLDPGSTRGMSNASVAADVTVQVDEGNLLVVVPREEH